MTTTRIAIKWHGGKSYLAKKIVGLFPPHLHYVQPFFGGGAVLFARDPDRDWMGTGQPSHLRGASEVVNDINGRLINFWNVLKDPKLLDEFSRRVAMTPFSQLHWREAEHRHLDPIQDAVNFFVRNRQSRQGLGQCFATLSRNRTRRGMNEQASAWLSAVEGLAEVHARLRGLAGQYVRRSIASKPTPEPLHETSQG